MIRYAKIKNVKDLERGTKNSAGIDFYIPNAEDFYVKLQEYNTEKGEWGLSDEPQKVPNGLYVLQPGRSILIPSGIKSYFSDEYALIAFNKSGIASKHSVIVGASVVDSDYQGEIHIDLKNVGDKNISICAGDKITQFILVKIGLDELKKVESEEELWSGVKTERGEGGFGHTGKK